MGEGRGAGVVPRRGSCCVVATASLLAMALSPGPTVAVDVNGGGSFVSTTTDRDGLETEQDEQQANLSLYQLLTPYLSARFGYQYYDLAAEDDQGAESSRRSREPRLELLYARPRVTARIVARQGRTDGSAVDGEFETDSLLATLSYRPPRGPRYRASFRDESNIADVGVFGESTDSRVLTLETDYGWSWGGASYLFRRNTVDNRNSGLESRQNRHEVRGYASQSFRDGNLSVDFTTSVSRLDRKNIAGSDPDLADPVPAARGLFAVDTAPEVGELDTTPGLIDGNTTTPAAPGIDIGGASTFRNVGLDLGVKSQVTRFEITVDTISDAGLLWEVYRSADNLTWETVTGVVSEFDAALLRYTLRFPETTERYFKAVNLSVNQEPVVRVTEVRALVDVAVETSGFESTLFRAGLGTSFQAGEKTRGRVELGFSNDEDISAGLVRRDYSQTYGRASLTSDLTDELSLSLSAGYIDIEDRRQPPLLRTEEDYGAGLTWDPLPTLDTGLFYSRREESDENRLLQVNESLRLRVITGLLPDLRLTSDLSAVQTEDLVSDIDREGWQWRESVTARPAPPWFLSVSYLASSFESQGGANELDTTSVGVISTWSATAYLTLTGSWSVGREEREGVDRETVRQSYGLSYNPGPKLSLSGAYQEFDTQGQAKTATDSLTLNYQPNNHFVLFGSLTRSRSESLGAQAGEITSLRTGLRFFI